MTNLPRDEFPAERIKTLYNARWNIESSFRKLKYTIGLSNFHAYKPEYVKQEIIDLLSRVCSIFLARYNPFFQKKDLCIYKNVV